MKAKQKQTQKLCEINEFNMDKVLILCYIRDIYLTKPYFSCIFPRFSAFRCTNTFNYPQRHVDKHTWTTIYVLKGMTNNNGCAFHMAKMIHIHTLFFSVVDLRMFQMYKMDVLNFHAKWRWKQKSQKDECKTTFNGDVSLFIAMKTCWLIIWEYTLANKHTQWERERDVFELY